MEVTTCNGQKQREKTKGVSEWNSYNNRGTSQRGNRNAKNAKQSYTEGLKKLNWLSVPQMAVEAALQGAKCCTERKQNRKLI